MHSSIYSASMPGFPCETAPTTTTIGPFPTFLEKYVLGAVNLA